MSPEMTDTDARLTAVLGVRLPEVTLTPASRWPLGRPGAMTTGGMVPSDDDLLEHTLRFSGSFTSDDGHVTIRRASDPMSYSAAGFLGHCDICARAGRTPGSGEPLLDIRAAVQFVARHEHGDGD